MFQFTISKKERRQMMDVKQEGAQADDGWLPLPTQAVYTNLQKTN